MDALSRLTEGLDEAERAALQARLWTLLTAQTQRYTQGDHSSLRAEIAEELYASMCLTLRVALDSEGADERALLSRDLDGMLRAGQETLRQQTDEARAWHEAAIRTAPRFANRSLRDTLAGIAPFFRQYDIRFGAHQIPAEIDYPPCLPVPETLQGVLYLRAYLRALLTENELLSRFDPAREAALLTRYYGDFEEPLVNLYEPVAACAVGLTLAGGGATLLRLEPEDDARLCAFFRALAPADASGALREAAARVCDRVGLTRDEARRYLADFAVSLVPRVYAALSEGSLRGVFGG